MKVLALNGILGYGYAEISLENGLKRKLAFPYSPSDIPMGAAYRFNVYHLLEVEDPSEPFTKGLIARLYHVNEGDVSIIEYPAAYSIKITIPRKVISGDIGDTDVYGAQQHAPLLEVEK